MASIPNNSHFLEIRNGSQLKTPSLSIRKAKTNILLSSQRSGKKEQKTNTKIGREEGNNSCKIVCSFHFMKPEQLLMEIFLNLSGNDPIKIYEENFFL